MRSPFFDPGADAPLAAIAAVALCVLWLGCEHSPAEPDVQPTTTASSHASAGLQWTVPPTWNVDGTASHGTRRAKYAVPASGDAKHPAEVLVLRLSGGGTRELADQLAEFVGSFEGPGSRAPKRETLQVGAWSVQLVEIGATYRFPMGPPTGPHHQAAAHLIKKNWRGIAATVNAKNRGLWLFRMVGPDDTVAAARSSFRAMIKSLK